MRFSQINRREIAQIRQFELIPFLLPLLPELVSLFSRYSFFLAS